MIPVLETERLRLRGHTLADFEPLAAMWADPAVVRFISGKPASREESWARLARYLGHWALLGYGFWAIEEKARGALLARLASPTSSARSSRRSMRPSRAGRWLRRRTARATPARR